MESHCIENYNQFDETLNQVQGDDTHFSEKTTMKFNKIVSVDHTKLQDWALKELGNLSEAPVSYYKNPPENESELINRIGDAEAVLVSWRTQIPESVLKKCPNLKYIGMACSLYDDKSANVAVDFAREKSITVKGIFDYGDPGVVEFIVSELIRLLHGYGEFRWKEMPQELTGQKIGIIGLGVTGKMLADRLVPFQPELFYFSRSRKKDYEKKGVNYLELEELLKTCDVISIHLPKNTEILGEEEFQQFGTGKILINTSLGLPVKEAAFQKWLKKEGNFAIFDGDARTSLSKESLKINSLISYEQSAGWSAQTEKRLSEKVLENIKEFLKKAYR